MNDSELLRYSRHILLDAIGIEGQQRILESHAVIVGAGGLGSPAALYLAAAGVGRITLVDDDTVDATNLQRQIAHAEQRIGQPKVESARTAMRQLNPGPRIEAVARRADAALLDELLADASVVLDCSDNYATRHCVNAACVRHGVALVSGAAIGFDGQVGVFDTRPAEQGPGPCYACLFDPDAQVEEVRCAVMGVLAPLVGVVGSLQALEALKLLAGAGRSLSGRLLLIDALDMDIRTMQLQRNPHCRVCSGATARPAAPGSPPPPPAA